MSERMTVECACERGANCTKTTMCATDSALADQADEYESRITELEQLNEDQSRIHAKQLKESYEISEAHLAQLEAVKRDRKKDCVDFFRWFWNQPGNIVEQGYGEWLKAIGEGE